MMTSAEKDEHYMRLALAEARRALGRTSPNPCVGALIVKDHRIIASGYHHKAGTPHAEVHALAAAGEQASGATMYVTLEPCNHTGKTPPCSHAVVKSGIARVVIGMLDPNPLVDGGGRQYLLDHSVEITSGILERECRAINEPFIKYITTGKPLLAIKAGLSLEGRLNYRKGRSGWITGPESGEKVHQLRDYYDAILVGRTTVEIDDPSLTTRLSQGSGHDPVRLLLDTRLSIAPSAKILHLRSEAQTWIFCGPDAPLEKEKTLRQMGAMVFRTATDTAGMLDLHEIVKLLGSKNITSVLIEGGGRIFSSFLNSRLADKVHLFYAPLFAGSAGESMTPDLFVAERKSAVTLTDVEYTRLGDDVLLEGKLKYPKDGPT
ncbi:MAG: bifunctional diaminohydroxyphosphoribosylaminopyrimidine deaminase/5-amino-6-(5-phosphoribosylamino)uracil reductase RibD [Desulfopila sp.]|jgi:diaminohydroxyphosphoribosylaminopyrimidine deaminase/5-amino-6-(5-phosphoribosylamino)uracil reductase|nr:bifunctional diaminohydroxyphosphoribosylaminopyrimidine deaminase/5-amino-6-(5-phosphoribosylamino)uracil reductase RibD [Desulfopila sp.]